MNLFFKRLTGKLKSTEKFENIAAQLLADAKRYHEIEQSDLMKEFKELEALVAEPRFQATKKEYQTKKYKETVEYKNYSDFKALQNDKAVKAYLQAVNDEEREKYAGAISVKNYLQLKTIMDEPGFETRRLFWENPKRWLQTEEYKKEARYEELKKSADLAFLQNAPVEQYKALESWRETFKASFLESTLEKNGLKAGFWFKNTNLKRDFSYVEEAQAFMGEKNVNIQSGVMSIVMAKGAVEAAAWDSKKGFHMHEFAYSSANVNTGDTFAQAGGKFSAKVRANGKCHGALYLVGEDRFPVIELYHYNGKNIEVGVADGKNRNVEVLKSLPANNWWVFEVEVSNHEIVWTVNGFEVFRANNPLAGKKLYFAAQCFAPKAKAGEGQLDFEYLRSEEKC